MNIKYVKITKNNGKIQHLTEILPNAMIPTNTIVHKTVTGCGATYSEIKANRNSIIIEPNVPVITGKCKDKKHKKDNLFGVMEGVYQDDIISYVSKSHNKKKNIKILTTPEGFTKVRNALEELDIDIRYDGYFVLFDECQKITKDSDYRSSITLPMNYFFQCQNKAIVSATPPVFSDTRFQTFTLLIIKPSYEYRQDIHLYTTNNVLQRLKETLPTLKERKKPIFLFVNYTNMIYDLITNLNIMDESTVFCSENSVRKLKEYKFNQAYSDWNPKNMKAINFMTSRFFAAVDIELLDSPIVVLVTDVFAAQYTMFDPYMDTVQIVGRFRNGISEVYHISNIDSRIPKKSKNDIVTHFKCNKNTYRTIEALRDSSEGVQRESYNDALAVLPYQSFLDSYGRENPYLVDNYISEEMVKTYYHCQDSLRNAYQTCDYFFVKHFPHFYKIGSYDMLKITNRNTSVMEKRKSIIKMLEILGNCETESDCELRDTLEKQTPWLVNAYYKLGKDVIEELNYSATKIKEATIIMEYKKKAFGTAIINLVK